MVGYRRKKATLQRKNMIPYGMHWLTEEDIEAVVNVLKSDKITQGPLVEEFEKAIAGYVEAQYGVAVNSGTAGLHLAYIMAGIGRGDEVITTPLTFAATSNALVHLGAKPVFVDIDEKTLNIDPAEVEKAVTDKTKAIAIVDFAGQPCELDELKQIAQKHNLVLIEDACHSLGSEYKERRVGGLADLTVFSFHPVKLINTGEGGMVVTNQEDWAERMRLLRHHGVVKEPEKGGWFQEVKEPGHNFRITDFQCALGISQFKKIDRFIARRREIVQKYNQALKEVDGLIIPFEQEYNKSAWHIYPLQFDLEKLGKTRKQIFDSLREEGIGVQVHYVPLHLQDFYQKAFGYQPGDFPKVEKYYQREITLPLFPKMTDAQVEEVVEKVKKAIKNESSFN